MLSVVTIGSVLAVMVTVFVWAPCCFPGLYSTTISPVAPGLIGSLGNWGTVHPQLPTALEIINGLFPVLVNTNSLTPSAPCSIVP